MEKNRSFEIVTLLKKYIVKKNSSEKAAVGIEGSLFWKSSRSKKVALQKN